MFTSPIVVISLAFFTIATHFHFRTTSASPVVDVDFEEVSKGLQEHTLIYIDVRNRTELTESGKIPGSFVIPGT